MKAKDLYKVLKEFSELTSNPIKFTFQGQKLIIEGTDWSGYYKVSLQCSREKEKQVIFLKDLKKIKRVLQKLKNAEIEFKIEDKLIIESGKIKIRLNYYENISFEELSEKDFKELISLEKKELELIQKLAKFASKDDYHRNLQEVLFKFSEERFYVAASDGYRFGEFSKEYKGEEKSFAVSAEELQFLKFLDQAVTLKEGQKYIGFFGGNKEFYLRKGEPTFPEYEHIFPESNNRRLEINRDELLASLTILQGLSEEQEVIFNITRNKVILESEGAEIEIPASWSEKEKMRIAAKIDYLIEFLKLIDSEKVLFLLGSQNEPFYYKDSNLRFLLMPRTIDED